MSVNMASKANGVEEWVRAPPPPGTCLSRFMNAIYNHEENSFLGRTPKRWGIVLTFYAVFYAVLALMFALCMGGLYLTLENHRPTYLLEESLIGANPGVAFRPLYETLVLRYNVENRSAYEPYVHQLNEFFEQYSTEYSSEFSSGGWYSTKKECTAADRYGFPDNPCIFIKVNKIIGWEPEYYDTNELPEDMPEDLIEHIQSLDANLQKQVWVSCEEEKANDTKLEYPWGRGMPGRFYPYNNQNGYRSPLVAVRLSSPAHNLNIVIRCRAWAKNIIQNKSLKEPSGYTRFMLYVEGNSNHNETAA